MRPIIIPIVLVACGLGAGAVAYTSIEPAPTVSWYLAHPTERAERMALCGDNYGAALHDADCQTAAEADLQGGVNKLLAELDQATEGK